MKNLSKELFEGFSEKERELLYKCVKTGLDIPDSALGCYATTPTDYQKFGEKFFDPVIREYHGDETVKKKHETDWDITYAGGVFDVIKLGLEELSMRVRVARNLKKFNLPGNMDQKERIELEKTMLGAFA